MPRELIGGDAGIVEGAVEPAKGDDRVIEHRLDVPVAGDVAGQGDRLGRYEQQPPRRQRLARPLANRALDRPDPVRKVETISA